MKELKLFDFSFRKSAEQIVKVIELPKSMKILEGDHPLLKTLKEGYNYSSKNFKEYIKYLNKIFYKFGKACYFPNHSFEDDVEWFTQYYLKMNINKNYPKILGIKVFLENIINKFDAITNDIDFIMEHYFITIDRSDYKLIALKDRYTDDEQVIKDFDNFVHDKGYYSSGRPHYEGIDLFYTYKCIDDLYLKSFDYYKYKY